MYLLIKKFKKSNCFQLIIWSVVFGLVSITGLAYLDVSRRILDASKRIEDIQKQIDETNHFYDTLADQISQLTYIEVSTDNFSDYKISKRVTRCQSGFSGTQNWPFLLKKCHKFLF